MQPEAVCSWLEAAIADCEAADSLTTPTREAYHSFQGSWGSQVRSSQTAEGDVSYSGIEIPQWTRSLATVRQVTYVLEHGKMFKVLNLDGWKVVVPKHRGFTQGEHVLFLEPDAFLLRGDANRDHLFAQIGPLTKFDGRIGYRVGTSEWYDEREKPEWYIGQPEREGVKKIISEGYVFHLSDFPEIDDKVRSLDYELCRETMEVFSNRLRSLDFSDELGIVRWQSFPDNRPALEKTVEMPHWTTGPMSRVAQSHTKAPIFIPKTDMKRVQECPNLFIKPKYERQIFQRTTKMDGATISVYYIKGDPVTHSPRHRIPFLPNPENVDSPTAKYFTKLAMQPNARFGVCSRNKDILPHLLPSASAPQYTAYWNAAVAATLPEVLRLADRNLVVQGELVGATIQGNPYGYPARNMHSRPSHEMFIFSISEVFFDNHNGAPRTTRWDPRRVQAFADKYGLKHVPVLGYAPVPKVATCHDDLRAMADQSGGEGLVFKNCTDGRWFKVLSNTWLMEKGDEMHARRQLEANNQWRGQSEVVVENEPEPELEPEVEEVEEVVENEPESEAELEEVGVAEPEPQQEEVKEPVDKGKGKAVAENEPKPKEMVDRWNLPLEEWVPRNEKEAAIIESFQRMVAYFKSLSPDEFWAEIQSYLPKKEDSHGNAAEQSTGQDEELVEDDGQDEGLVQVETLSLESYNGPEEELGDTEEELGDAEEELGGPEEQLGGLEHELPPLAIHLANPAALPTMRVFVEEVPDEYGDGTSVVDWLGAEGWGLFDDNPGFEVW